MAITPNHLVLTILAQEVFLWVRCLYCCVWTKEGMLEKVMTSRCWNRLAGVAG